MKNKNTVILLFILAVAVVGIGYYLWTNQVSVTETEEELPYLYEDDYLSFEYPDNVKLLFDKPAGGRSDSQSIEFLAPNEDGEYESTGLHLSYLVNLSEENSSSFDTLDDLMNHYGAYNLEMNEYTVDGRDAVQIVTGDMTGQTFFLVIPSEDESDAYRFNGAFMNETVDEIIELFVETAELAR